MNAQDVDDIYELSPLQQGMLFHTLYEPESRLYFEQVVVPFEGGVNLQAFEKAWNCVAEADTAIRTSFHWEEIAKPVQVVHKRAPVPVEVHDIRSVPPGQRNAEIASLLAADRQRGFDLQRAPLLRVAVIEVSATSFRLVLSFHHIILDGWSLQLVVSQFSDAYAAFCTGKTPAIAKSRPYSDHIRWLQKQDLTSARNYWRKMLGGVDVLCRLAPNDAAQPGESDYAEHSFELPEEASGRLRDFAARQKLTLNTLVQGTWALLLHRLTGSAEVLFGVTVSGRPAELRDVEKMIGLFINTVPLRTHIDSNRTVAAWLNDLQRQQFDARQFDYSPLVQVRQWSEIPGSGPLFDTLLAFENYPVKSRATDGSATFVERTNYPLSAAVVPSTRLNVRLLYNRGILTTETVRQIGFNYAFILDTIAKSESGRIGDLPKLTEHNRAMLTAINATRTDYPSTQTVTALWREMVAAAPDAPAAEFGDRRMTYGELDLAARKVAAKLRSLGVSAETPVAIRLERSLEFVIAVLGILRAGGTYVPLDTAYPPARVRGILEDIGVKLLVTSKHYATQPYSGEEVLVIETLMAAPEAPAFDDGDGGSPDGAAYVMYTSGSTGIPKGIVVPHRAIVRLVRNTNYAAIQSTDRIANLSNCAFDAATFEIWGALLNGACVVGIDRETALSPASLSTSLRQERISTMFITTALFNQLVAETPDVFGSLRLLLFGGEAVDPKWVRVVLQAGPPSILGHVYGPTESTTFATWYRVTEVDAKAATVSIGGPISNTTAYVLDADLDPVPTGGVGELYLGGDGLARGYYGKSDATGERFLPDPFSSLLGARMYRTGDLVRWRIDGAFEFVGRLDKQVKLRGHRIELGELERRLQEHPQVRQAVATVRNDASGARSLAAYYLTRDSERPGLQQELRTMLREYLPDYMQPATLQRIDALPLNGNGKVDYAALPDPELSRPELEQPYLEPKDDLEKKLVAIWQQVLGLERIGTHDGFFDIGGHSLRATQLVSRIRRELGVEIPLRMVFEHSTIADLAERIRHQSEAPAPAAGIARLSRDGRRRVLA